MLKNTFLHIPGIGRKTEEKIWSAGLTNWNAVAEFQNGPLPQKTMAALQVYCPESQAQLARGNPIYFQNRLTAAQGWRLFPEFRNRTAYLDIETDGLDSYYGHITTIALYDGRDIFWYINGRNLDDFAVDIQKYQVLVTYNGKTFDLPFIQSYLRIKLPQAHIDLRYVLASLGYKGGLKRCEQTLGIERAELNGVDGALAPLLWREYQIRNDRAALETLLAYNIADVVNLETLMVIAYNLNLAETPFARTNRIGRPHPPVLPFEPDRETIAKISSRALFMNPYDY